MKERKKSVKCYFYFKIFFLDLSGSRDQSREEEERMGSLSG